MANSIAIVFLANLLNLAVCVLSVLFLNNMTISNSHFVQFAQASVTVQKKLKSTGNSLPTCLISEAKNRRFFVNNQVKEDQYNVYNNQYQHGGGASQLPAH